MKDFFMTHIIFWFGLSQVQSAALGAMKEEMIELATRLTRTTKERDYMEKALNRVQVCTQNYASEVKVFQKSIFCPKNQFRF